MTPTTQPLDKTAAAALTPPPPNNDAEHDRGVDRVELLRIAFVAFVVALSWFVPWRPVIGIDVVAWGATLIGGYPIFKEAFSALRSRRMTMELSMTIALAAALSIGEAFTALVIVLFVLVAEVLEHLTVGRGRQAIRDLMDFLPRTVVVRAPGGDKETAAADVHVGDVVLVKPGAAVPIDGVVVGGHSFVDQAMVTGESLPIEKWVGATVFAGTVNQSGALEVRATGIGRDTAYARIIEAVELAEKTRAPIQKTADRLSGYLVYFALGAAGVTLLITGNARATISVIIVAGACGVAAGTPLAILGAIGRAAHHGAVIKGGLYLEALGRIDTVVLDKTGTITLGIPLVIGVHPAEGVAEIDLLAAAATAEASSEHPLGRAVLERAAQQGIKVLRPDRFAYTPGRGIACSAGAREILAGNELFLRENGTVMSAGIPAAAIYVAEGGRYLGALVVADVARPETAAAVRDLKAMGLEIILMTGDVKDVASKIAAEVGIHSVHAGLLPEQKMAEVRRLQQAGRRVAMVGDGVNDAPALAQADVGIGMGSGTEIAREAADVVLLGNDLSKLVDTFVIARRCRAIIFQNFAGTIAVDAIGIILAALNVLNPLLAA